jgi:hypothetical protein
MVRSHFDQLTDVYCRISNENPAVKKGHTRGGGDHTIRAMSENLGDSEALNGDRYGLD